MNQTLSSTINLATARATSEVQNKTTPILKPGEKPSPVPEKSFHEKQLALKIADPANQDYEGAKALGKAKAMAFIKSATDTHDNEHEANFKVFKDVYNLSTEAATNDFIDQCCNSLNAHPYEMRDPAYEDRLIARYKPVNDVSPVKMKLYDNFVRDLKTKIFKVGYRGDKKFVAEYTGKYNLGANSNMKDGFEPRN